MPPCQAYSHLLFLKIGLILVTVILFVGVPILVAIYKKLTFRQGIAFTISAFFLFGFTYSKPDYAPRISHGKCLNNSQMKWSLTMHAGKNLIPSEVNLMRTQNSIFGRGRDKYGNFTVEGDILPDKISLVKKYETEAVRNGGFQSTIVLSGILKDSKNLVAMGIWESKMKIGYEQSITYPVQYVPVSGKWQAKAISTPTTVSVTKCQLPANLNPLQAFINR